MDHQAALDYLELALTADADQAYRRAATILAAEAHLNLGKGERAQAILNEHLTSDAYLDLYLGLANCSEVPDEKLALVNVYMRAKGLADVSLKQVGQAASTYDRLTVDARALNTGPEAADQPLVTVIMPAFNSADFIGTAIQSLLAQTWRNTEVLVVDDCSTDNTAHAISEWAERDPRVRLIKAAENGGPYVARNLALREAAGRFVTCNDADDWSHPQKLALQAQHLLEAPDCVANDSQQTRATEDLQFYRRGNAGWYTFRNMSSFMFRRDEIAREIGFWDCVRFGADSEFIKRINIVFGQGTVESLETGPVSFQRQSEGSLTAHSAFGYHGFHMGARLEYPPAASGISSKRADVEI
ncbi:MAG: glycosyltransferase family A protein [Flavimaricola sp.]|nr:glycosyltransferase family A protein [Flavimaricola sp.]